MVSPQLADLTPLELLLGSLLGSSVGSLSMPSLWSSRKPGGLDLLVRPTISLSLSLTLLDPSAWALSTVALYDSVWNYLLGVSLGTLCLCAVNPRAGFLGRLPGPLSWIVLGKATWGGFMFFGLGRWGTSACFRKVLNAKYEK